MPAKLLFPKFLQRVKWITAIGNMSKDASFNLDEVKAEIAKRMQQAEEPSKSTGQ